MQADDPPFLPVGTDVSAKYKGAFCEAKVKKVVKNIKCKVTLKSAGQTSITVTDEAIKGTLRVGNTVEVRQDPKKDPQEAIITKIQDCSQYTVVFDDGDITTLRRSALCLKSGRHFAESETLDQLPLTHPEHFGNPVIGSSSRRGRRTNRSQSDDSDSETTDTITTSNVEREPHTGRVVLVQCGSGGGGGGDKKRPQSSGSAQGWFPGLVVAPGAQDTVKIKVKEDYLVRSFKDGRYYTVPKKEAKEFKRSTANSEMGGIEAALQYLDKDVLPPHWDRDILFGQESQSDDVDSDDSSDDEPREEKDHFVAQLYKFMDDRGTPLNRQPTIANKDIDLYRLFKVVHKMGGYNRVTNQNQWKGIAIRLGFQPATTSVTNLCKQAYKKFLHSFEEFYRKLGVTLVAHPRGSRSTGRSLIRDKDKIPTHSSSPAHSVKDDEKPAEKISTTPKSKEKDVEKDIIKVEEKDTKEKDTKEKDTKEKEPLKAVKEVDVKEKEIKGKDLKVAEKESKKETAKAKAKKETKVKQETVPSSEEEDSGDNQPLIPVTVKLEKSSSDAALSEKSLKVTETPVKKVYKNTTAPEGITGKRVLEKGERSSVKKVIQRRGSISRREIRDSGKDVKLSEITPIKKKEPESKVKEKESVSAKKGSSSDKNDSDSSSRGSKSGKPPPRRNVTPNDTPPSTPGSTLGLQPHSTKKPRKRKLIETSEPATPYISCDVGDKLKVYYGPTQSESKVTYEAKVIEIAGRGGDTLLRVHYTGWNTRYDEWIKPSRIADNLTQKNKHKDKGKRNQSNLSDSGGKRVKQGPPVGILSSSTMKVRTRNRSSSNNTSASNQQTTDVPSDSDSECESDSSGQRSSKRLLEDKIIKEKSASDVTSIASKVTENEKEKLSKMGRVSRSPQVKRSAESAGALLTRTKRVRVKQEDRELPRGRDFDLNEIRSELKGFEKVKSPTADSIKVEVDAEPAKEEAPSVTVKQEKTPDKITEDIYEFKEPEPFEFEARKSEEKKKRTTLRIFDDLPQLKLSPTQAVTKSPVLPEEEKSPPQPTKSRFDSVFDKLCVSENFNVDSINSNSAGKESEALSSIFSDVANEDSGDRLVMSETEDSQGPLFTYQSDIFQDKPFMPIFKGFIPAKNQETYSKKDAAIKLRDVDDDLISSSATKGEHSSDEDPIGTAIKRVNEHSMSDDSNDSELLKTPTTPVSTPNISIASPISDTTTSTVDSKPNVSVADTKPKISVAETKTKSPLIDIKTKTTVVDVRTKSPLIDIKTKATTLEVKTRSPLLDIKTKPALLEAKVTKSPLIDIRPKPFPEIKTKSPLIDIRTKALPIEIKSKSPLLEIKTKANLLEITKNKTVILDIKSPLLEKSTEKSTIVEAKEISKPEEKLADKPIIAKTDDSKSEPVQNKQENQSTNVAVSKEPTIEAAKKDELDEKVATDSESQSSDAKAESDVVGSYGDIVIPEPTQLFIQKEGPSMADNLLRAINNNKRAATPTPKETKLAKLDSSVKVTKVQTVNNKSQTSKVTSVSISVSDTSKTLVVETTSSNNSQTLDNPKDSDNITSKLDISTSKESSTKDSTVSSELFAKTEPFSSVSDSLAVKKDIVERRKSGAEPTTLGGKSNKVLSETIQKLSSQISQPTPPLPEYKDERSDDSDSSESDRRLFSNFYSQPDVISRLIIDKLSEEESQSGISESTTSQPPKVQSDKSTANWSETDSQKDGDMEKANVDSTKDLSSTKVPEEDSNISLLLCEETIPGSPAPETLVDGVKTTTKQKSRNLEMPFASAPSISPDHAKDPLFLKDLSREDSRDGMGSSRSDRDRERDLDRDPECLRTGANTVDTVMDNTPPITPDSSLDNMSPSRDQLLSDGDNPSEMNKPNEEESRASAISKKLNEIEKSNSTSNLRGSAPGSPIVGTGRRGRRPRSLRASEGEDHHQNSLTNLSSITGAHSSPQYNAPHPKPLRYNFYVELDAGMDAAQKIGLLTSRLADLRKAYHNVKTELAAIDRRRKKLRRKEREAVKAAKAACAI